MTLSDEMGNLLPGGSYVNCLIDDLVGGGIENVLQLFDYMVPPASRHLHIKHPLTHF